MSLRNSLVVFMIVGLCVFVKAADETQEQISEEVDASEDPFDVDPADVSSVTDSEPIDPINPKVTIPIDRRRNLSYTEFMTEYLVQRKPVILQGEMDNWEAMNLWTPEWFAQQFPNTTCDAQIGNQDRRKKVKLGKFVEYLRKNQDHIPMYCEWDTVQLGSKVSDLMRQMEIPKFFANDWFVGCTGQFHDLPNVKITPRALYFGGKRSGIVNHVDNLNTWVFSYQLAGRKRWKLHDPYQGAFMYDGSADLFRANDERFPLLKYARGYDFVLEKGEILFWPVGFWHSTYVLEEVSIGFSENFINFFNFEEFYNSLKDMCNNEPNITQCRYRTMCKKYWGKLFSKGPRMTECSRKSVQHYCRLANGFDKETQKRLEAKKGKE